MNSKINLLGGEYRASTDNTEQNGMIVEGRVIVFDQPTVLYEYDGIQYKEVISRTALDGVDLSDVVMRYNHMSSPIVLARTRNKSLQLEKKNDGLYFRAQLQNDMDAHKEMYAAVKSGLLDKMSFGFTIADSNYDSKTHTNTITKIGKLFEISIVDQPAYEQTHVEARSRLKKYADGDLLREATIIRCGLLLNNLQKRG